MWDAPAPGRGLTGPRPSHRAPLVADCPPTSAVVATPPTLRHRPGFRKNDQVPERAADPPSRKDEPGIDRFRLQPSRGR